MKLTSLPAFNDEGLLRVIVETPKGSRNKCAYEKDGYFKRKFTLPEGMTFPFDFGCIPSTKGEDGDPLDILVLADAPLPMGCVVEAKVIGAIKAEQKEEEKNPVRNDRLIAVANEARLFGDVEDLENLRSGLIDEITEFFVSYNAQRGKDFRPLGSCGAKEALQMVKKARA